MLLARLKAPLLRVEKFPLAFVLGAACLHLALFVIFALKIAYKPVLLGLAICVILAAAQRRNRLPGGSAKTQFSLNQDRYAIGYAILFAIFTGLYFVNAWAPEFSPDGSGYHLELVARYLRERGFVQITTNIYAGLGQGAEMLYSLAFAFGQHSAAALVHLSFAVALALGMLAYGVRIGKWWVGAGAALLVYLSPVVGRDASTAYIDVVPAAIAFSAFYWLELWEETGNDRLLIVIGLLSGYAYATKYTAVTILPFALAWVAIVTWKTRTSRAALSKSLLTIGAWAAVMMLPWMLKDWIYLRDPIAPFGAGIFRNPYIHAGMVQEWAESLRRYDMPNKWKLPMEMTLSGGYIKGIIGPVFLLAPLGLLALRFRAGRLLLAGAMMFIPYFGNIGARFLIPCLPFFAMAMTLAIGSWPRAVSALVLLHAIASWPPILDTYAPNSWRITDFPLSAALRREPADQYLRRVLQDYALAKAIDQYVPPGERILSLSSLPEAYTSHEILVAFQGAFNQDLTDSVNIGWLDVYRPKVAMVFQFPERTLRRIRVVETARLKPYRQWSVHELRYLRRGVELPRSSAWRLRAWPNQWEVQFAFDNSPVTRWRTWETAVPGMFIETDFGTQETVSEVRVETSEDDKYDVKLQVEGQIEPNGPWVKIASEPVERPIPVPYWLRRAATAELHAKGVNYLLVRDSNFGASDIGEEPADWGLQVVAHPGNAILYRIAP
jgi:hypothetical protein